LLRPVQNEVFADLDDAFIRVHNWGFTQGFFLLKNRRIAQGTLANRRLSCVVLPSFFFCQAFDSRINNTTAVLRGLIYLLIDQQPSLVQKYDQGAKKPFEGVNA
jgi:hypothetical protein